MLCDDTSKETWAKLHEGLKKDTSKVLTEKR